MDVHCRNAAKLADFLQTHPKVRWVNYPGLKTSRYFERAKRLFAGYGGALLTFGLGDRQKAFKFINSLKLAKNAANLGDAKTLVIHPGSTIFHEFSAEQKEKMGIADDMVRVSVGIENYEDIQKDFEQAIKKIFEV
jgi:O-acetylhomoserine (thiol)-lyase